MNKLRWFNVLGSVLAAACWRLLGTQSVYSQRKPPPLYFRLSQHRRTPHPTLYPQL